MGDLKHGSQIDGRSSTADLVDRLRQYSWRGEIVGPHGSGKSTLLAAIRAELASQRTLVEFVCRAGQRCLPDFPRVSVDWNERTLVVVDGFEQLSVWTRWRLKRICRRLGSGLLVTTHRPLGLPTLYVTQPRLDLTLRIVHSLWPDGAPQIPKERIEQLYQQHRGNVREVLFGLYDWYESQRRAKR